MASGSTPPDEATTNAPMSGPTIPRMPGADGLADHHRGGPVAVHQAVAADGGAAVAADRVAEPVGDHRHDGHDPALGDRVGQVRDGEEPDAGEVERAGAVAVDEPADERAHEAGGHQPEAVDEAELGCAGAQGDDVDGEVREDDLVGETVERRPDDRHVPVALLPPHEGGGAAGPREPGGGRRNQQWPARAGSIAWRRGRRVGARRRAGCRRRTSWPADCATRPPAADRAERHDPFGRPVPARPAGSDRAEPLVADDQGAAGDDRVEQRSRTDDGADGGADDDLDDLLIMAAPPDLGGVGRGRPGGDTAGPD